MPLFVIDVNLPYRFSLWNSSDYVHQKDLGESWSDSEIWDYAKKNNLTIITKDADFTNRILVSDPPPKVVHIRVGNLRLQELHQFLSKNWSDVLTLNRENKLVVIRKDRIESVKGNPA